MPKLPRLTAKRVLRILRKAGFYVHHQTGSHINLRHPAKAHLHVVVPDHSGMLAPKTLKAIIVQSELTVEDFVATGKDRN